jgi:YggT family protein
VILFLQGLDVVLGVLRGGLFGAACVLAVVAGVDWAVRTRRINPFNPVARFFRTSVDPLIAPVERRIVRAGGLPTSAPWWALVFVVVGGIVLITALEFIRGQLAGALFAMEAGPSGLARLFVSWTFGALQVALFARVVSTWFGVSPYAKSIRWAYAMTEWFLAPIRQVLPAMGPLDLSPLVAYFLLNIIGSFVSRSL